MVLILPLTMAVVGFVTPASATPVSDSDMELLIKVRLAGLWEIAAGQQAQQQAASQAVQEIGAKIVEQHRVLDEDLRVVAGQLGVVLPNRPSEEQQDWLVELSAKWGPEFDRSFATLLRRAHGRVFSVIAQVRAGTRNETVRAFADRANDAVRTQMTLLEGTGQVDFNALREPAAPAIAPAGAAQGQKHDIVEASARTGTDGVDVGLVIGICLVELVAVFGLLRLLRTR
jgi:predicted outer membrane protein